MTCTAATHFAGHYHRYLQVARSADGVASFQNAATTWVDGPNGIEQRLNKERLPWEADGLAAASKSAPDANHQAAEAQHRMTSLAPFVGGWGATDFWPNNRTRWKSPGNL